MENNITIENAELFKVEEAKKSEREVSKYPVFIDFVLALNPVWIKIPREYRLMYLKNIERLANDTLRAKGYLFLNDVYDMLGIMRNGQIDNVGWIYDEENPVGDNFVDFNIFREVNSDFINGYTQNVLLDFNVDGDISNRLKDRESQ